MHKLIPNIFTFISNFKKEEILNLDKKVGIIFRNYEKEQNKNELLELRQFCKMHNRKIYLANNLRLSVTLDFDGYYIPAFNNNLGIQKYNLKKDFLIFGSAHNALEIRTKEKQGAELIFLSPIFKIKKYKRSLEIIKFNILVQKSQTKIIALGGINKKNIKKLKITNVYGFSGISYFK